MIEKILSVKDEVGLHARPASLFVKLAQEFDGSVLDKFNKISSFWLWIENSNVVDWHLLPRLLDNIIIIIS